MLTDPGKPVSMSLQGAHLAWLPDHMGQGR